MDIDEAWSDDISARVDLTCSVSLQGWRYRRDTPATNPNIGSNACCSSAIDDRSVFDEQIKRHAVLLTTGL
jgi:hypothetical protein